MSSLTAATPLRRTSTIRQVRQVSDESSESSDGGNVVEYFSSQSTSPEPCSSRSSPTRTLHRVSVIPPSPPTPPGEKEDSPWIGGTGLGSTGLGKSGRVIERLMAENDRLRREMRAEITKREELQRSMQNQRPKLEGLQTENSRLSNAKAMDDNIIKRRDRKIEELRTELSIERRKRETFQQQAQEAERRRENHEEDTNEKLQQAAEEAKHAMTHASILETSHKQLAAEYRQRTATINKTLKHLLDDKAENVKKLAKLDIVTDQMRQESERLRKIHSDMLAVWEKFEGDKHDDVETLMNDLRQLKDKDSERERWNQRLWDDMRDVMGQMKWIMTLKKHANENGIASPPPSPPMGTLSA